MVAGYLGVLSVRLGTTCINTSKKKANISDANIHIGIHEYARRTRERYKDFGYTGLTSIMVAGAAPSDVAVYSWTLDKNCDQLGFSGAMQVGFQNAIGSGHHGSLYFSNSFHKQDMTTAQRISLAHLCVSETCEQDPRVGMPVEIAVVRVGRPPIILGPEELSEVQKNSENTIGELQRMIQNAAPAIPGLTSSTAP